MWKMDSHKQYKFKSFFFLIEQIQKTLKIQILSIGTGSIYLTSSYSKNTDEIYLWSFSFRFLFKLSGINVRKTKSFFINSLYLLFFQSSTMTPSELAVALPCCCSCISMLLCHSSILFVGVLFWMLPDLYFNTG